ncbi:histidine kinase [Dermatophilaceae bacterium Soc4.6]
MVDLLTGVTVGAGVVVATALTAGADVVSAPLRPVGPLAYLLVAASGLALAWRNAAPTTTVLVTVALGVGYQGAGFPGGPAPVPIVLALYSIAHRGARLQSLGLGLLAILALLGARSLAVPGGFASPLLIAFPITVLAALFAGQLVAARRGQRQRTLERQAAAEQAREYDIQRRVDAERLRIARELHDVVAHNISLINVQATMGAHVIATRPAEATEALVAIKSASKQALRELRSILQVLRQADETDPTAPAPGLADLDAMLASTAHAGVDTVLTVSGTRRTLPSTVDVAAYRIIQESLTNVMRYAGPAPVQLQLHYADANLSVQVDSDIDTGVDPRFGGSGQGIAGMRERAAAVGGTLHAAPDGHGRFLVRADLPLTVA